MNPIFISALLLGITSNLHCLGMCGPIAMAIPVNRTSNLTIISGIVQYNLGRIFTYGVLGFMVGSIGLSVESIGWLQVLSIVSGIAIILYAWRKLLPIGKRNLFFFNSLQGFVSRSMGKTLQQNSVLKLFIIGSLNGLLPCGMVFIALVNALLSGTNLHSMLAMVLFGIGTLPMMLLVSYSTNKINTALRLKLSRKIPYLLTIVGLLVVLRGMNLGIPFLSPKVNALNKEIISEDKSDIKAGMSCCHGNTACKK